MTTAVDDDLEWSVFCHPHRRCPVMNFVGQETSDVYTPDMKQYTPGLPLFLRPPMHSIKVMM